MYDFYSSWQQKQPNYPMYQQPLRQQIIRVTGIDGAKAYPLGPNSTVALFDQGEDIFYVKSTDGAGFPTIRPFAFTPLQPQTQNNEYVTRKEFDELKELLLNGKQPVRKQSKQESDE